MAILLLLSVGAATAQTQSRTVEPGTSLTLENTELPITGQTVRLGTLRLEKGEDDRNLLMYRAPERIAQALDEVTYTVGGEEKSVAIQIRSGAGTFGSDEVYSASVKALFKLFVLAVVIESGLQLVFRWRPYLRTFETSAVNALIAFAFSWIFVGAFELDITTELINAYSAPERQWDDSTMGYVLTAMIVAGGSAGVNRVFRAFGVRPVGLPADIAGPPDDDTAWLSVTLKRDKAAGAVDVLFGEQGKEAVVGTIPGSSSDEPLKRWLFRDKGRFPPSGGYAFTVTDKPQVVKLVAQDDKGKSIPSKDWGPHLIGPRAIIDIERTL